MSSYDELVAFDKLDSVDVLGCSNLTLANKISGPRLHLNSSYLEQFLILDQCEVPKLYTGFEKQLGLYNDSLKIAKTTYKILHRIEKYPTCPNTHYTLILQDVNTGVISVVENSHYEKLAEDHGYFKPFVETDFKQVGNIIEQGSVISKGSHDDYFNFRYGVNANVAYISKKDNIEDGIIISESFAKRVTYASVKTIEVTLGFNDILLNTYGDSLIYRSFPDIFTDIRNGIFCVKRSIDNMSAACNTTVSSLMNVNTNDEIYYGDGKLIDVDIFINSNAELAQDNGHRQQIIAYYNIIRDYKYKVMIALERYVKDPTIRLTTEANTKYQNYKSYIDSCNSINGENQITFVNSTGSFEFAFLKFTIGKSVCLSEGSKLTNRFGGKGVVCKISPDELMPIDEYGNRAEIILNPLGVIGRSNSGQLYEQELNFIASDVARQMREEKTTLQKYLLLQKFLSMVDKDNGDEFKKYYAKIPINMQEKYLNDIIEKGIYVRQHPFKNLTFEEMKKLYIEFNVRPSKITVSVINPHTKKINKYKSKNAVVIGKEYIMVLKHTPESKLSSVSISDVNNISIPHKSTIKAKNLPFRNTPIKLGEMEVNIAINRVDPLKVNRLMAGNGNNLKHRERVARMLLEEDPLMYHDINIKDEEIVDSIASDAFVAILNQIGYTIFEDKVVSIIDVGINED